MKKAVNAQVFQVHEKQFPKIMGKIWELQGKVGELKLYINI